MSKKLMKSAVVIGALTFVSRIFGFIRDMVVANVFGAGAETDAFFIAFKIPNFMRRLFGEGAFAQAFVPVLSEYKAQRSQAEVKHLIDHVTGSLSLLLLMITFIGMIGAPLLVMIFAPGFSQNPEKFQLTVDMLRITFPYILFIALTALAGGILNTYGQFAIPAFTPVFLNLTMIAAALFLTTWFDVPIMALAWGVCIAGLVQLLFQFPFLHRLQLLPRPRYNRQDAGVNKIYSLMIPALFGVSVAQINMLVDSLLASFLQTGSVSWLYYSDRLMEFPIAVFGLALATATLPSLSRKAALGDFEGYNRTLDWAMRWILVIVTPCIFGFIFLAEAMMTTLFYYGEFSRQDVLMSAWSLTTYSIGLSGFVLVKVLASGFYARQDTRTPVKIAFIAMLANIIFSLLFISHLQHAGLALATSLAAILNAGLLYRSLVKAQVYRPLAGWLALLLQVALASICMSALLWWGRGSLENWMALNGWERALHLGFWIGISSIVYGIILLISGLRLHHLRMKES